MRKIPFATVSKIPGFYKGELKAMNIHNDERNAFLRTIEKTNPRLFNFIATHNPDLLHINGLGAVATTTNSDNLSWWQSMLTTVSKAIPAGLTAWTEVKLAQAQVKNAVAGKPPIDSQAYIQKSTPTATVSVGVNPQTQKTIYIVGGVALLGVLFMAMNKRG
jgi:hypothetical protein